MISALATATRTVVERIRADWLIVLAAFTTITLAAVLLASGPIYAEAVTRSALQRSLSGAPAVETTITVETRVFPAFYDEVDALVRDEIDAATGGVDASVYSHLVADAYELPGGDGELTTLASIEAFQGIESRATVIEGSWPTAGAASVAVNAAAADSLGLVVGDSLDLANRRDGVSAMATIVGVWEPNDLDDPYWLDDPLIVAGQVESASFLVFGPFVVTPETLFEEFTPLRTNADWRVLPDFGGLVVSEVNELRAGVAALGQRLDEALLAEVDPAEAGTRGGVTVSTGLPALLAGVDRSLAVTRASVLALLAQLGILAGYAIVLTAGLMSDTRRLETELTRSRGASPPQIAGVALLEGLLLTVPAVLLAPYLATALLRALNEIGPLAAIDLTIDPAVDALSLTLATAAAIVALIALTWTAFRAARRFGVSERRNTRQSTAGTAQRIGADIALLALAAIVFWQLQTLGPQLSSGVRGRFGVDPVLVVAPALALLAGAVLGLRIVPLLARGGERLAASRRATVPTLAAWQLSRRPRRYARSSLLLMLAIGIGVFAASYSTTWIGSQRDQAAYAAGADVTAAPDRAADAEMSDLHLVSAHQAVPGVTASMPVNRQLRALTGGAGQTEFIALDAAKAPGVVNIRGDLAPGFASSMGELVGARSGSPTLPLPGEPVSLTITFGAEEQGPEDQPPCLPPVETDGCFDPRVRVVIRDGDGMLHRLEAGTGPLSAVPSPITVDLASPLSNGSVVAPVYPVSLLNVELESQLDDVTSQSHRLTLHGIDVGAADGSTTPVAAGFEEWVVGSTRVIGAVEPPAATLVTASERGLVVDVDTGAGAGVAPSYISLRPGAPRRPPSFPIVVSDGFLASSGLAVGDDVRLPPLRVDSNAVIVGTLAAFPTVDGSAAETIVFDLATYQDMAYEPGLSLPDIDEYWMSLEDDDDDEVVATLAASPIDSVEVTSRAQLTASLLSDPIALGIIGALTVGFVAAAVFACMGFAVSATVSARERLVEFALFRALGLSGRQLGSWLAIEQGTLVFVSLGLGTLIGVLLTSTLLPLVTLTQSGAAAIPPVLVEYPWPAILAMEAAVVAALGLIVIVMTFLLRRTGLGSLLRMGED